MKSRWQLTMNDTHYREHFAIQQSLWDGLRDKNVLLRMLPLAAFGLAVALALTWFMHFLIASTHHDLDSSPRMQLLDFVRLQREESSERKEVMPQKPQMNQQPEAPQQPQADQSDLRQGDSLGVSMGSPQLANDFDISGGGYSIGMNDGDYLPIVKIAPIYPARASRLGIEGTCVVQYTVTPQGTVTDVSVVTELCPHEIFHRVSVEAAYKFRYKPRVIDGEAIAVPNVKNRFIFEMDKGG